jgi:hypothetical protein
MKSTTLAKDILKQIEILPVEKQERVLEFARTLTNPAPHGVAGETLLKFAHTLDTAESEAMIWAIDGACEQVDKDACLPRSMA